MPEQKILCRKVLLEQGWKSDQLLELDSEGLITSIRDANGAPAKRVLEGPVIPGMPNVHSHAFQRFMAGLTSGVRQGAGDFWGWRQAMYGFAGQITPEQLEAGAAWLYAEMLCAGYTSCGEFHYLHHQADGRPYSNIAETSEKLLSAADQSGISLTLLPVYYQVSGFGQDSVEPHQRRFANSLEGYLSLLERVESLTRATPLHQPGIAPHSLRAVPSQALSELLVAVSETLPVHIHIAEQIAEVEDCLEHLAARPVEWLLDNVNVDQRWCLVHATHMDRPEARRAAASGASTGLCPSTEADLGDGFFDTFEWLQAGGCFGIGSDSNLIISPAEELRLLEFTERLRSRRRNVLQSRQQTCGMFLWSHAARTGARALAQPAGCISSANRADLVELDPDHPLLAARSTDTIMETLVFAGLAGMVRSVYVAGNEVVSGGRHINHDTLASNFIKASQSMAGV